MDGFRRTNSQSVCYLLELSQPFMQLDDCATSSKKRRPAIPQRILHACTAINRGHTNHIVTVCQTLRASDARSTGATSPQPSPWASTETTTLTFVSYRFRAYLDTSPSNAMSDPAVCDANVRSSLFNRPRLIMNELFLVNLVFSPQRRPSGVFCLANEALPPTGAIARLQLALRTPPCFQTGSA